MRKRIPAEGARLLTFGGVALIVSFSSLALPPSTLIWKEEHSGTPGRIVPFVPTPPPVVEKMLELAQVGPKDVVYDLGSGDGRIVIMAAQKFGARAVGVELDSDLCKQATARITELGLEKRAQILNENFFDANFRAATVVTLYLLTSVNEQLRPVLEKQLRPGTRVVSHDFQITGWKAENVVTVTDENGISHTIYLYMRP